MKKVILLLCAIISAASLHGQAQTQNVEIEAGANFSDYSRMDTRLGFHVGVRFIKDLSSLVDGVYINVGSIFSMKGAEESGYIGDETDPLAYYAIVEADSYCLDIPIHLGYKFAFNQKAALFLEFGPYFSYGLFGKFRADLKDMHSGEIAIFKEDTFSKEGGVKRFDFGLGFRCGIEICNRVPISIAHDFGLVDVSREDLGYSVKTSNLMLSIGCKF